MDFGLGFTNVVASTFIGTKAFATITENAGLQNPVSLLLTVLIAWMLSAMTWTVVRSCCA